LATIREQLKHDRAQEVATEAVHWTQAHRKTIIAALAGALVLAAVILGVYAYSQKQNEKASVELGEAMRTLNTPVRQAGEAADPNQPSFTNVQERDKAALGKFEAVASSFPHTDSGHYALYLAAVVQLDNGDTAGAEKGFERARKEGNREVSSLAKAALADIYFTSNREKDGVQLLHDLIDNPSTSVPKSEAQIRLAQHFDDVKKKEDAVRIYEQLKKDNANNPIGQAAEQRIKEITATAK